ncbi:MULTISPECIES: HD domain-containing protein [unclassified Exiguobacterium]|uniref:HD domain-containing protein n=1 Tax=unclassified Exiguobacterium TaxID=2644629 RepID=UPI001EF0FE89|nr:MULTISPECIES: HD domain-containing protein [unclassified Exiguobacterium]
MQQIIEQALRFAAVRHDGQFRKGTNIPYVTHPVGVSMLLVEDRQPVPVIVAGLLHDLLEDTLTTSEELTERFGSEVTRLVLAVSEPEKHHSWEERKRMTIQRVSTLQYDEVALLVADKLHNLRSIRFDVESAGKQVWDRFNRPLRDQSWYYHELLHAFQPFAQTTTLIEAFETELNLLFYGVEEERSEKLEKLFGVIKYGFHEEEWFQETSTLCQTAYELNETMREGYRHGFMVNQPELDALSAQLREAGMWERLPLPTLQAIDELSYRMALKSDELVAWLE